MEHQSILDSPAEFFAWCMRTVDQEQIPIKRSYPKYASVPGAGDYLWKHYDRRMAPVRDLFRKDRRTLEVGCGLGVELHWFALQGAEVVGIDVDSYSVECAHRLTEHVASAFNRPLKIDIRRASILDLPGTEPFDFIYMKETLHHLEPRDQIFEKIGALLAPGGDIIVLEPNALNPFIQLEMFLKRGTKTVVDAVDAKSGQHFVYGDERIMTPRYMVRRFKQHGIDGYTEIFRWLPTAISSNRVLTSLVEPVERRHLDAWVPPLCIHAMFQGRRVNR